MQKKMQAQGKLKRLMFLSDCVICGKKTPTFIKFEEFH